MYDINKRRHLTGMTVAEVIEVLSKLPKDADILCGGDSYVWLHVEEDGSAVNIDYDALDDVYEEE